MKKLSFLAAGFALLIALAFTTCELGAAAKADAEPPNLKEDLISTVELNTGDNLVLAVEAESTDGGSLNFKWYRLDELYDDPSGTPIGTDSKSLSYPVDTAGVFSVYVVITNTNPDGNSASVTSNTATVFVLASGDTLRYPIITEPPVDSTQMKGAVLVGVTAEISEDQASPENVTLTYQWFQAVGNSNKNGTQLTNNATYSGVTTDSLLFTANEGTYYFYVKVTAAAVTTKTVTSRVAVITVIPELRPNANIIVNSGVKYQYVRGFGGMGPNTFQKDPNQKIKAAEFEKMFGTGDRQLGLNILRIMIGNDFETDVYQEFLVDGASTPEYDNPEYPKGKATSVPGDPTNPQEVHDYYARKDDFDYYEGVKIVNKYGGYVLASPWTPPAVWKTNNSKNGGAGGKAELKESNYGDYAKYLRDYCDHMLKRGAPIYVVSIQNEPNFAATYDGCDWTNNQMRDFFLKQGHFTTEPEPIPGYGGGKATDWVLTMNGESANTPSINDPAMLNAVSRDNIDVLGRHLYGSALYRYAEALDKNPKKEVWMTEHNINSGNAAAYPNDSTWNYVWLFLNDLDLSIRQNDESAFIWWYLKRFYCIIGDGTYGTSEGEIYPRGYALSQYAKYAKEMRRIGVSVSGTTANGTVLKEGTVVNPTTLSPDSTHVRVTGFMSEDGKTISLVLYTPTSNNGNGGYDLGNVKIQLPSGFIVRKADAMRSTATTKIKKENVLLYSDKKSALIQMGRSEILSVRFTKE